MEKADGKSSAQSMPENVSSTLIEIGPLPSFENDEPPMVLSWTSSALAGATLVRPTRSAAAADASVRMVKFMAGLLAVYGQRGPSPSLWQDKTRSLVQSRLTQLAADTKLAN